MDSKIPMLKLNNGVLIPQIGLGAAIFPKERAGKACLDALKVGYRHIDTAHGYGNEVLVGEAIKESKIPRNEIFLTSKLGYNELGEGLTSKAIDRMLKRFQVDYIDLLLIHWPLGDFVGGWKDMEKAVEEGKVKSIGLSNFYDEDLKKILDICKIKPVVDQVECYPYFPQNKLREQLKSINCYIEAYSPIGRGSKELFNEKILLDLSNKYKKSVPQIILRWHIDKQNIIFPKSTKPEHMKDNLDIFDFKCNKEGLTFSQWEWCLGLACITFIVNFVLKFIKLEALCRFDWGKIFCCPSSNNEEDQLLEEEQDPEPQDTQKGRQIELSEY